MGTLLRLAGTCPKCKYVYRPTAPPGRVTWRGKCPNPAAPDCDGQIIARRPKGAAAPAKKTAQPAGDGDQEPAKNTAPPARRARREVIEVGPYVRTKPAQRGTPANVQGTKPPEGQDPRPADGTGQPAKPPAGQPEPEPEPKPRTVPRARHPESGPGSRHPYADLGYV